MYLDGTFILGDEMPLWPADFFWFESSNGTQDLDCVVFHEPAEKYGMQHE